jgi:hypothetical protein
MSRCTLHAVRSTLHAPRFTLHLELRHRVQQAAVTLACSWDGCADAAVRPGPSRALQRPGALHGVCPSAPLPLCPSATASSPASSREQSRAVTPRRPVLLRRRLLETCHCCIVARRAICPLHMRHTRLYAGKTEAQRSERGRRGGPRVVAPEPWCRLAFSRTDGSRNRGRDGGLRETRQALWHVASLAAISHCGRAAVVSGCVVRRCHASVHSTVPRGHAMTRSTRGYWAAKRYPQRGR